MVKGQDSKFIPVDLAKLQVGMLVDRHLHVHLPVNGRYVMLAKAFQPLEQGTLDKIKRYGGAFALEPEIGSRYPQLEQSAHALRGACDGDDAAPFEKSLAARNATDWLVKALLGKRCDSSPALFVMNKAFGVPGAETLLYVSDVSVEDCERGLRLAAVAGMLAIWLGYVDTQFMIQFAETVFCAEARAAGKAPGVTEPDYRFLNPGPSDELAEAVALARWLLSTPDGALAPSLRVVKKLRRQFKSDVFGALVDDGARRKVAA